MLTIKRPGFLCLLSIALWMNSLPSMACSKPPGYGYIIHSILDDFSRYPLGIVSSVTDQTLTGDWVSNDSGAQGNQDSFEGVTNSSGNLSELGKATPATWKITSINGPCSSQDVYAYPPFYQNINFMPSSSPQNLTCTRQAISFSSSPSRLYGTRGQQNVTATGDMYGKTPVRWVTYDSNGDLIGSGNLGSVTQNSCVCYWSSNYFVYTPITVYTYLLDKNGEGIGTFSSTYSYT
jgi:hypothetical protein